MSYAMADLGWKFYMINASWNIVFLVIIYFTWIETRRLTLEEIAIKFGDLPPEVLVVDGIQVEEGEKDRPEIDLPKSHQA